MNEWTLLLAAAASFVTAGMSAATLVLGLINRKKTDELHLQINSRMEEFMENLKTSYFAKGVKAEKEDHQ